METRRERMLAGESYNQPDLERERHHAQELVRRFNRGRV
jgi:hypothetical protein